MHRLRYDTESRELAQCCGHGVFSITPPQLHCPTGAKDEPALPYNWPGRCNMLLASTSLDAKHLDRGADHCSWASSFLWVLGQISATMLSRQMICIPI